MNADYVLSVNTCWKLFTKSNIFSIAVINAVIDL